MASFTPNAPVSGALQKYEQELARLNNEPRPYLPDWFVRELNRIGGRDSVTNKPNFRIVWGQNKEAMKLHVVGGVATWRPTYLKGYYTQVIRLGIKGQMINPVIEKHEPVGMPCYFIEKYIPARKISQEYWEANRWYIAPDDIMGVHKEDVMGPYPSEGHYVEYLCLQDPVTKEAVKPCQMVLDELDKRLFQESESNIDRLTPREAIKQIMKARKEQQLAADLSYLKKQADVHKYYKAGMCGDATVGVLTDNLKPFKKSA